MLSFIFEYGASLFDAVLVVWFITKFCKKGFELKKNPYWIPAIGVIFVYTIFSDHFLSGYNALSTIIFLSLYIVYSLIIGWNCKLRAIVSAVAFEVILVLLSSFLFMILSLLVNDFEAALQGADNYVRYILLILHKVLLFAVCKILLRIFRSDDSEIGLRNELLTISFSLITVVGAIAAMIVSANSSVQSVQVSSLVITIAFIFANVFLYFLISQILKLQKTKQKLALLESKIEFENQVYEDAKGVWEEAKKSRHDIKQHLTVVNSYLNEQEYDKCQEYIDALLPSVMRNESAVIKSDNIVIDYVINSKLGKRKDIDLLITGTMGDISDIAEPDMVSLLGNILDNAIEATEKTERKKLELIFYMQSADRCVICKNSITSSVLESNKSLKTTKKDSELHGNGTAIIKQIASKYNGLVDFYEEKAPAGDLLFCVQVMIPGNAK